jgi:hypothetical protein
METVTENTRKQLCRVALVKMMHQAKKDATAQFKSYPGTVKIGLEYETDDAETILTRLLNVENRNYDKYLNIKAFRRAKTHLLDLFIRTKEIYDDTMNFNQHGYDAQLQKIVDQLLVLKKINYLKDQLSKVESTKIGKPKEKIQWLGTPSEFGFLFNELERAGYIKKANHKRQKNIASWSQTSTLLFDAFSVPNQAKDGETSEENLRKELSTPSITSRETGFIKITRTIK